MNTLTGNTDTDEDILLLLSLSDVINLCSTNKYINNLCHNKRLKNKYLKAKKCAIDLFNDMHKILIISSESMGLFTKLMETLNIVPTVRKNFSFHNLSYIEINISKAHPGIYPDFTLKEDDYIIGYYLLDGEVLIGRQRYYGNEKSIIQFLIHLCYDHLYDVIDYS